MVLFPDGDQQTDSFRFNKGDFVGLEETLSLWPRRCKTVVSIFHPESSRASTTNDKPSISAWSKAGVVVFPRWACDLWRQFKSDSASHNVAVDVGESHYKGFTVENVTRFLDSVTAIPNVTLGNEFPF